ncbi:MAG TPA: ribonuclease catalytic domain-containing protein [Rectinemataceae bacterium]|nr:ribonuclease catalytic domain-containing protein [Rectinemataceae bacterium]
MIAPKSLALYKNRPAFVVERRDDKLEIRLEDGSSLRVRDKDLEELHPGPISALPPPAEGGDFETAWAVLAPAEGESPAPLPAREIAELVFGSSGPAETLAAWAAGIDGALFKGEGPLLLPLSELERAREAEKRAKKAGEAAAREAFVERARKARGKGAAAAFVEEDERFLLEIEAQAFGKAPKGRLAADIGIGDGPAEAHAWLLAVGRWDASVNPHPRRSGCPLASPRVEIGRDLEDLPRRDLRHLESWAIDNAWSNDPDDAIAWDGEAVWIHVADPAAAIVPDSPADREALGRGMTLYLPELTSTLLPPEALERFGLGLTDESKALSFRVLLDPEGAIESVDICASSLSVRRTHYAEADAIASGDGPGAAGLRRLGEIAQLRRKRRLANGAIDIDIPEVRVFVRDGQVSVESLPDTSSSGTVREMMLLAGEAAARWAFERGLPFPYYSQEAPGDPSSVPEGLAGEFAKRRLMRAGITGPTPSAHRGLGLPFYSQATSPLRRYADLLAHMQIRAFLAGRPPLEEDEVMRRSALAQAAAAPNRQAERDSESHWTLAWLLAHPEWRAEGHIVGASGPGAWTVFVPSLGLESKMKLGPNRALNEVLALSVARIDLPRLDIGLSVAAT